MPGEFTLAAWRKKTGFKVPFWKSQEEASAAQQKEGAGKVKDPQQVAQSMLYVCFRG